MCRPEPCLMASVSFISCSVGARDRRKQETRMNMKRLILAGCSVIVLGAGTAWAGPCDMGRTTKTPVPGLRRKAAARPPA